MASVSCRSASRRVEEKQEAKICNQKRFESLVSVRGSFVSIYIDDSRNTADAEAQLDAK